MRRGRGQRITRNRPAPECHAFAVSCGWKSFGHKDWKDRTHELCMAPIAAGPPNCPASLRRMVSPLPANPQRGPAARPRRTPAAAPSSRPCVGGARSSIRNRLPLNGAIGAFQSPKSAVTDLFFNAIGRFFNLRQRRPAPVLRAPFYLLAISAVQRSRLPDKSRWLFGEFPTGSNHGNDLCVIAPLFALPAVKPQGRRSLGRQRTGLRNAVSSPAARVASKSLARRQQGRAVGCPSGPTALARANSKKRHPAPIQQSLAVSLTRRPSHANHAKSVGQMPGHERMNMAAVACYCRCVLT